MVEIHPKKFFVDAILADTIFFESEIMRRFTRLRKNDVSSNKKNYPYRHRRSFEVWIWFKVGSEAKRGKDCRSGNEEKEIIAQGPRGLDMMKHTHRHTPSFGLMGSLARLRHSFLVSLEILCQPILFYFDVYLAWFCLDGNNFYQIILPPNPCQTCSLSGTSRDRQHAVQCASKLGFFPDWFYIQSLVLLFRYCRSSFRLLRFCSICSRML